MPTTSSGLGAAPVAAIASVVARYRLIAPQCGQCRER